MKTYDCLIVGAGAMGSAAMYFAAQRGWSVAAFDRFGLAHNRGSSHGRTRIIRHAYFEHPDYVPLARQSSRLWSEIERASGETLFVRTGLLQVGPPEGPVIQGTLKSARRHDLEINSLTTREMTSRFPMFRFDPGMEGLFEPVAGMLFVEKCVRAMIELAIVGGAEFLGQTAVKSIARGEGGLWEVQTDRGTYISQRLVITSGAWTSQLLSPLQPHLRVTARHQHWFTDETAAMAIDRNCPAYLFETEDGCFYGFPQYDNGGFKVAEHSGFDGADDPDDLDRNINPADFGRVNQFISRHLTVRNLRHIGHSVCMYTMSPDGHFLVDLLDKEGTAAAACGFSGHGFKFAPVIGQALVELVSSGRRPPEFDFLRFGRSGISFPFPQ
jgi:sarcosine oxidase